MPTQAKPSDLTKAQKDALSELLTLYGASQFLGVGYQTLAAAAKSGALTVSHRLDTGEQRRGKNGLPLFTKAELTRWNENRSNRGLTVEKAAQFLAEVDPAQARELLKKYLAQTT